MARSGGATLLIDGCVYYAMATRSRGSFLPKHRVHVLDGRNELSYEQHECSEYADERNEYIKKKMTTKQRRSEHA